MIDLQPRNDLLTLLFFFDLVKIFPIPKLLLYESQARGLHTRLSKLQVTLFVFYYSETFEFVQFYRSREIDCPTDSLYPTLHC